MKTVSARNIYEVLETMKEKPELWLTSRTISALQNFLNGYFFLAPSVTTHEKYQPDFNDFKLWVIAKKPAFEGIGNPFSTFLLADCEKDEELAFDRFFEYLEIFIKENPKV